MHISACAGRDLQSYREVEVSPDLFVYAFWEFLWSFSFGSRYVYVGAFSQTFDEHPSFISLGVEAMSSLLIVLQS